MVNDTKSAKRLADLQRRVAEQKRLELARRQLEVGHLTERSHALAKTLDGEGLAWRLFPDMSIRHLGKLISEMALAKNAAEHAALVSWQEAKRFEKLERKHVLLRQADELQWDNEQRLENAVRPLRSSLPQA